MMMMITMMIEMITMMMMTTASSNRFPLLADGSFFTYTSKEPVGVCGQIIPVSDKVFSV